MKAVALLLLCMASLAVAQQNVAPHYVLRNNPFTVPPEFATPMAGPATATSIAPENLKLHALMPGPANLALVSVNGYILRLGESYAGNTLIAVGSESARFRRENGNEFELELRPLKGGDATAIPEEERPADNQAPTDEPATAPANTNQENEQNRDEEPT